jgi:hypothetical protein
MAKKKELDQSLEGLAIRYGFRHTTPSGTVQDVMNEMRAPKVRQLLTKLIDHKIDLPSKLIVVRLATAWLLQREIKHQTDKGSSLLPYDAKLYKRAVNYGKRKAKLYK